MNDSYDLESLYTQARQALKAKNYDRASDLLRQILLVDENYKDASRLLAHAIKLKRRRWYSHPLLWSALGLAIVFGFGIWLAPRAQGMLARSIIGPTSAPTQTRLSTETSVPTIVPSPRATTFPLAWKRVSIGQEFERDTVTTLVIDPRDPEVLYVGMENAGVYKSIDGGQSWQPTHYGLTNSHVTSLLIDYQNPEVLFAGTMDGIYTTENGGETWHRIGDGTHVLMDPQDSLHLYARDDENIYTSTDRGNNWRELYSTKNGCPNQINTWAIHPTEGETLFVGSEPSEECEEGFYWSIDGGNTWRQEEIGNYCTDGLMIGLDRQGDYYKAARCGTEYIFLVPLPASDLLYSYWGADHRLYKEDADDEQRLILGNPDVGFVRAMAVSPDDPYTLYAAGEGMAITRDGGLTWTKLNNGLGNTLLQLEAGDRGSLYTLLGNCEEDWSSEERESRQSLFYSPNGGTAWSLASQSGCYLIKDADGDTLYRVSTASTWREGNMIYWIWRSEDAGRSWGRESAPPYITIVADPSQNGFLYLSLDVQPYDWGGYQQYISEDYGHNWKANNPETEVKICYGSILRFIDAYRPMAIDPFDGNHVLVIDNRTLLESHDSCETTSAFAAAPNASMNSIAFDLKGSSTLYAGTDQGAYVSFDDGESWEQINDGLLGATVVYSIVVDKDGNVYAATPYGVFKLEAK